MSTNDQKPTKPKRVVHPLEISPELMERIQIACEKSNSTNKAEIMRQALSIGLFCLEKVDHSADSVIAEAAIAQTGKTRLSLVEKTANVAEEKGNESSHSIPASGARGLKYPSPRNPKKNRQS